MIYIKTKSITLFLFQKAVYKVADTDNSALLEVNYRDNSFKVTGTGFSNAFENELQEVAKDLLKRKHNKNFAEQN